MFEQILVATDGSDDAERAAETAVDVARQYDATLHAIYVIETRTGYDNAIVDPDVVRGHLRRDGEKALATVEELANEAGVSTVTAVERGVPHERIREHVAANGIDLVVLGSKGTSALKAILLGSTTDAVLRTAAVPVLVVGAT